MRKPKIVIIGAGSVVFGLNCIEDAFANKELWGSELVLVDLDPVAVNRMKLAADRINAELGGGYSISCTTDRTEALPGADFVIVSIAINRMEMWKHDFRIPQKHGIRHVLGENAGPGALFHTMRNVGPILDICRDMEKLCPHALLINYTNPESRLCIAIHKYTSIRAVGLCHQIHAGIKIVSAILDKPASEIEVKAWGLNHLTWMKDIRDKHTGENLYPLFREKERSYRPDYEPLSRFVFHRFGLFPTSGDGHLGEFFPYAFEMMSDAGYDYDKFETRRTNGIAKVEAIAAGSHPIDYILKRRSGERAFDMICGIVCNSNEVLESANIPNKGLIPNIPADAIVEVPVVVSGNGVDGIALGEELPRGIAAICTSQVQVQHLAVDAAVRGDRSLALQALLVDPNVPSVNAALRIFDELMEVNKPYLPQFQ